MPADEIRAVSNAEVLPPAAMGDVIAAVKRGFTRIGIIDGYFEGQPSVWHKEVLWAIDQGVLVFGAASIGALRAAELHQFGMIGIGDIFKAYAAGHLEDDDEVALVHGPRELGYQPLSEPMVNIRLTLTKAVEDGVIAPELGKKITDHSKGTHFSDRTWANVLDHASLFMNDASAHARLSRWLADNKIDQKKRDALQMLDELSKASVAPKPNFDLQWTVMWDKALGWQGQTSGHNEPSFVLDELRLAPDQFANVRRRALSRILASRRGGHADTAGSAQDMSAMLSKLRREHGLFSRTSLENWMELNALDMDGLERILATDSAVEAAEQAAGTALEDAMIDELKRAGMFVALSDRANAKRAMLDGAQADSMRHRTPSMAMLLDWFANAINASFDPDKPENLIRELALSDTATLHRLLADEFLFRKLGKNGDTDQSDLASKEF